MPHGVHLSARDYRWRSSCTVPMIHITCVSLLVGLLKLCSSALSKTKLSPSLRRASLLGRIAESGVSRVTAGIDVEDHHLETVMPARCQQFLTERAKLKQGPLVGASYEIGLGRILGVGWRHIAKHGRNGSLERSADGGQHPDGGIGEISFDLADHSHRHAAFLSKFLKRPPLFMAKTPEDWADSRPLVVRVALCRGLFFFRHATP